MSKTNNRRRQLITLIHVAKAELQMADDVYRQILNRIGNADSTANMTIPKLEKVLEHLKSCGFKVRSKSGGTLEKPSRPLAQDPESRKARALWLTLHELGAVKNPSEAALAAYAKRITGVEALQWIAGDQAELLIESLKKWALRYLPRALEELVRACEPLQLATADRQQLNTHVATARQRATFDPMVTAWQEAKKLLEGARRVG